MMSIRNFMVTAIAGGGSAALALIVGIWLFGDTDSPPDWWQTWMALSCIVCVVAFVVGIIMEILND
jgi:hypothetical protein